MTDDQTATRTVEEIVENEISGEVATALSIYEIKCNCANLVDEFADPNQTDHIIMWDVVDYHNIPREFIQLCQIIAEFEVRL